MGTIVRNSNNSAYLRSYENIQLEEREEGCSVGFLENVLENINIPHLWHILFY